MKKYIPAMAGLGFVAGAVLFATTAAAQGQLPPNCKKGDDGRVHCWYCPGGQACLPN